MALSTARDFLYTALRKCGQLRPGYQAQDELMADGLNEWQLLFDGYNAQRTMNFTIPDYIYPVTGVGHATIESGQVFGCGFEIGPTALDFVGPRPTAIVRCNLLFTASSPSTRVPISPVSAEEWASISTIQLTPINVATVYYYEPRFPNGVLWVWPPLNGNSIEIFTWGFLTPPSTLNAPYSAPPGYAELIVFELAKRLWPMVTKDIAIHRVTWGQLCGQAAAAKASVRALNAPMPRLASDFGGGRGSSVGECSWSLLLTGVPY